ncbi:MAG: hypothetical protein H6Q59_3147, partial [Firmicutes bacterium]|nr:hypothetical protein [Bacillota bacterium]
MMIDNNTTELKQEIEKGSHKRYGVLINNAILSGVAMSVITVLVWFLLSGTVKSVGAALLIAALTLIIL